MLDKEADRCIFVYMMSTVNHCVSHQRHLGESAGFIHTRVHSLEGIAII